MGHVSYMLVMVVVLVGWVGWLVGVVISSASVGGVGRGIGGGLHVLGWCL